MLKAQKLLIQISKLDETSNEKSYSQNLYYIVKILITSYAIPF